MKTLIILNGSKCSGKSAISRELWKSRDKTILLSLDTICWLYSSYDKEKKYSLELAGRVGIKMVEQYLEEGLDIIVEKAFNFYEYVKPFVQMGEKMGAKVVLINIEAPLNVLIERTKSRVNTSMKEEVKITTEESIKLSFDNYNNNIFPVDETYDSSTMTVGQIVEDITNKYFLK